MLNQVLKVQNTKVIGRTWILTKFSTALSQDGNQLISDSSQDFLSGVLGLSPKSFLVQYLNLNGRSLSTFFEAHVLYYHVMYYINKIIQYSNSRSRKHVKMLISVKYIDMHILIIPIDMLTAESWIENVKIQQAYSSQILDGIQKKKLF